MSQNIQNLIDVWEQRPRRQLDYSGLTAESLSDLEWTNAMLKALIPSMREIREKFQIEPTPPIVLQMPPLQAPAPQPDAGSPTPVSFPEPETLKSNPGEQEPASQPVPPKEPGADAPSKPEPSKRGKGRNTGNPKKPSKAARTAKARGQKSGSDSKSASVETKPTVEPPVAAPSEPASTSPATTDLTDPPAPTLTEIG